MDKSKETLDTRQKNLIAISAFTSKSDVSNLKTALNEALDTGGLTINGINEALAHLYAYVGFPRR